MAGPAEIHLLNHQKSEDLNFYSKKLTQDEISDLPKEPIYVGSDSPVTFLNDEQESLELLLKIIAKMNSMQDPKFHSFPLASFCAHLAGMLYKIIVTAHRSFSTSVVLSGSGNTSRTGKSLMTSCWQLVFLGGYPKHQQIKITEASMFEELDQGCPVYLREWAKHADTLNLVIPMIWERLGRSVKHVYQNVNAVVFVDANLSPSDVKLAGANESKVTFIATGSDPLQHPNRMELCKEMVTMAQELHRFLPVLLSVGLNCMLKRVTDSECASYDGILKQDGDDRESQVLLNYDRVHSALDDAITEFGLERPPLFKKPTIDRNALTYYNGREETKSPEEMAEKIVTYLVDQELSNAIEFSEKRNNFKLKLVLSMVPEDVTHALKSCTKETTAAFGEKHAVKVRLLSADLLSEESLASLHSMIDTFDFTDWVEQAVRDSDQRLRDLGEAWYQQYAGPLKRRHDLDVDDEFCSEPRSSKQAKITKPDKTAKLLMCTVPGCPAFISQAGFKTAASYKKHCTTSKGHMNAVKTQKKK